MAAAAVPKLTAVAPVNPEPVTVTLSPQAAEPLGGPARPPQCGRGRLPVIGIIGNGSVAVYRHTRNRHAILVLVYVTAGLPSWPPDQA